MSEISDEEVALQLAVLSGKLEQMPEANVTTREKDSAYLGAKRLLGLGDQE